MLAGAPREIKDEENRVDLLPSGVEALAGIGIEDKGYRAAGKEPLSDEYPHLRPGQILFTYFHFAASRVLTDASLKSSAVCIAYETVETSEADLLIGAVLRKGAKAPNTSTFALTKATLPYALAFAKEFSLLCHAPETLLV